MVFAVTAHYQRRKQEGALARDGAASGAAPSKRAAQTDTEEICSKRQCGEGGFTQRVVTLCEPRHGGFPPQELDQLGRR
jgi:hypothetical protein